MRKWFACLSALGLAATAATAQTIPASIGNYLQQVQEDDGKAETSWKIFNPTPAGEAYDVDFNTDGGAGMNVYGLAIQTYVSQGPAQNFAYVAVCGDNLALDASGRTPDIGSPLSILNNPTGGLNNGYCTGFTTYDLPDVNTGTGGVHGTVAFTTGDTTTWLCADMFDAAGFAHTGPRHSFWTSDNFATPSSYSFTNLNWMIRLAGAPATPNGGVFLVNGSTNSNVAGGTTLALQFWSQDSAAPTKYLELLHLGSYIPLPPLILQTGLSNFSPIPIQALGQLSGPAPCSATGLSLNFSCYFMDNLDLKKNGKKKIKLANDATANFTISKVCNPNICFGIRDDGVGDGGIFNPRIWFGIGASAGSKDAATVHMGFVSPNTPVVTNLTTVEQATWDFCGTGACWQQIGVYPANTGLDPTGNTPDLSSPVTSVGGTSACSPLGYYQGSWGFPATVYNTPSAPANTTTDYHTSMEWANGDSCLFVMMDLNGTNDDQGNDCAPSVSNAAGYYSLDGFATASIPVGDNLMQRINWN